MNCSEIADFLLDYVEGVLPSGVAEAFEHHLHECPTCITYLENYRTAIRLGRLAAAEGGEPPLPEEMVRAILASFRTAS